MSFDYSRDDSLIARYQAGLDIVNHEAFWIFEAIDKLTGDRPKIPSRGLLPPKNESLVFGEGFVIFSIKAKEDAYHMAEIEAEAEIIFDENEPILTPKIFNTIDDSEPMVEMIVDYDLMSNGQFEVKLNKFDNGSGVNSVSIYEKLFDQLILITRSIKDDFYVLPIKEKGINNLSLTVEDNVGNINELNNIYQVKFDFKSSCPKNCSNNGICENSICKCNKNYTEVDCSVKSLDILNSTKLELFYNSTLYERKSFNLTLRIKKQIESFNLKILIKGFPNQTYFIKHGQRLNNIIITNGSGTFEVFLPIYFTGPIFLESYT